MIDANGKTIVVEADGTIIIGGPEAAARAGSAIAVGDVPETVEVEYLTGERQNRRETALIRNAACPDSGGFRCSATAASLQHAHMLGMSRLIACPRV